MIEVIYHKRVDPIEMPAGTRASTYLLCIQVREIKKYAENLVAYIADTSWISKLDAIGRMSYEDTVGRTVQRLVEMFGAVNNDVTSDFGQFMVSLSSGESLKEKHSHVCLPISELWKEKTLNNHGFDFHTLGPSEIFSFGESKYLSSGNGYAAAAKQVHDFSKDGKDKGDAVHLQHFQAGVAIENLDNGKKGYVIAFSINSIDHERVLKNSLRNDDVKALSLLCDELYIIGVKK